MSTNEIKEENSSDYNNTCEKEEIFNVNNDGNSRDYNDTGEEECEKEECEKEEILNVNISEKEDEFKEIFLNDKPIKYKLKAFRMNRSYKSLIDTSFIIIFFQRVFIFIHFFNFIYNCFNCFNCFNKDEVNKTDDDEKDIIILKHQKNINSISIPISNDIESNILDIPDSILDIEDNDIKDEEFIFICNKSSLLSSRYAIVFRLCDTLGKCADIVSVIFLPLGKILNIPENSIIIILCFCVPTIMLQFFCDFGKLEDKYSALYSKFKKLSSFKDENRVDKYNKLVFSFRNNWVYSDFVRHVDVDYETQYDA